MHNRLLVIDIGMIIKPGRPRAPGFLKSFLLARWYVCVSVCPPLGGQCFFNAISSVLPCGDPWAALLKCWLNLTIFSVLDLHVLSTGYRLMVSLISCQGCTPAEVLHPSQGRSSSCAHRAGLFLEQVHP